MPRKAIGAVSGCSQLPVEAILQGKSNMRLSRRVAYLHFVLLRCVFQNPKVSYKCYEVATSIDPIFQEHCDFFEGSASPACHGKKKKWDATVTYQDRLSSWPQRSVLILRIAASLRAQHVGSCFVLKMMEREAGTSPLDLWSPPPSVSAGAAAAAVALTCL